MAELDTTASQLFQNAAPQQEQRKIEPAEDRSLRGLRSSNLRVIPFCYRAGKIKTRASIAQPSVIMELSVSSLSTVQIVIVNGYQLRDPFYWTPPCFVVKAWWTQRT